MKEISREELHHWAGRRIGLLVGPMATVQGDLPVELNNLVASTFRVEIGPTYLDTAENALDSGVHRDKLVEVVKELYSTRLPNKSVKALARGRWSAVLSLAHDSFFDQELRQQEETRALGMNVTSIDRLNDVPRSRSIPVFRLMGSLGSHHIVVSNTDLENHFLKLADALKHFTDVVHDCVVCVGLEGLWPIVKKIIAALTSRHSKIPANLIFLKNEMPSNMARLASLVNGKSRIFVADVTRGEAARALAKPAKSAQQVLDFARSDDPAKELAPLTEFAEYVNRQLRTEISRGELGRLLDILFSPSVSKWDPFHYDLDFPRTATADMMNRLRGITEPRRGASEVAVITGSVATGKTTVMKRLAYDLAKEGRKVIWLKTYEYADRQEKFDEMFRVLKSVEREFPVFIFIDDPGELRVFPIDVYRHAARHSVKIVMVIGMRASDWALTTYSSFIGSDVVRCFEEELDDQLDDFEWNAFPEYLVTLGLKGDLETARQEVNASASQCARDTLALLYFFMPGVQSSIRDAIRDEYFRLGDSEVLSKAIRHKMGTVSLLLQSAYQMIAVSETYRVPVPVEVLVSALGIGWVEWAGITHDTMETLGLFYPSDSDANNSVVYKTRNWVVRSTVVELVNGGKHVYAGSIQILRRLLSACTGTLDVYREYAVSLLISARKSRSILDYQSGLDLFRVAQEALPLPDKALKHHEGIWVREHREDLELARAIFVEALETPNYPNAPEEHDQHIHTSIAATVLNMVEERLVTLEDGKRLCMDHYEKARSDVYLNPHAVHTYARLMGEIGFRDKKNPGDSALMINKALVDIDTTILAIQTTSSELRFAGDDQVEILERERAHILSRVGKLEELKQMAKELWNETMSQHGFSTALQAHRYQETDRGKDYSKAWDYFVDVRKIVEGVGVPLAAELAEAALLLYYRWQVVRKYSVDDKDITSAPNWQVLYDLSNIGGMQRTELWKIYIHALSLCHLGHWMQGQAIFSRLHGLGLDPRTLYRARDCLLDSQGRIRRLEGMVKAGGAHKVYIFDESLGSDILVSKNVAGWRVGSTHEFYVEFTFGGPRAVRSPEMRRLRAKGKNDP